MATVCVIMGLIFAIIPILLISRFVCTRLNDHKMRRRAENSAFCCCYQKAVSEVVFDDVSISRTARQQCSTSSYVCSEGCQSSYGEGCLPGNGDCSVPEIRTIAALSGYPPKNCISRKASPKGVSHNKGFPASIPLINR